jgi:hypothetical protein
MENRRHKSCVIDLGAPSDMQDGSCAALPVMVSADEYGYWAHSFWMPDEHELEALNAGGSVVLQVRVGGTPGQLPNLNVHPVISLSVTPELTEPA